MKLFIFSIFLCFLPLQKRPGGTEHMTRITIGSESPQAFHGSSTTVESSRDAAALDALKVLVARAKDLTPAGDGSVFKAYS